MGFLNKMEDVLLEDFNESVTENGALGYRTTGKSLLDLNFAVSSLRSAAETNIAKRFEAAYLEDKLTALKWLFFARDVRGGLGERRVFRAALRYVAKCDPEDVRRLIPLVPEYGRFDDLWGLLDEGSLKQTVIDFVSEQLKSDLKHMEKKASVSLLAKWLPSPNASSKETKHYAKIIREGLGMAEGQYRKTLSKLRAYLKVVEVQMSAKRWKEIEYESVPSRANLIYNSAFLRNDEERRRAYLAKLERGETKINASTLFPHDIVCKYGSCYTEDETLEALWKNLPDTVSGADNGGTVVVADGSGSMTARVGNSGVRALDVANALAIYFAEKLRGEFRDKYITFSSRPQLVDFSHATSLRNKIRIARRYDEVSDTNIEAVFDLILSTAVKNRMTQNEIPANILIISDMEFNGCARVNGDGYSRFGRTSPTPKLFDAIRNRYEENGYKLPRLVFWNVNSRTETIPVRSNELGVALVSGFSPNVAKMVMSGKLDPYECLLETLNSERYQPVEDAIMNR